jgi:hypothetical protein
MHGAGGGMRGGLSFWRLRALTIGAASASIATSKTTFLMALSLCEDKKAFLCSFSVSVCVYIGVEGGGGGGRGRE